jgi:TonB-linked SusC/RagA family outer membrane protein
VISGTVKSEQGQLLQGANVFITEMNVSVGSNQEGVYRITLAPERVRGQTVTLRVRAIGFQPQQRQITLTAGSSTQDFTLRIDINKLSEVVVTGVTGATEAKKLAFTVSKVDVAELTVPGTSALSSLQGRVAGATVVVPSGRPGTSPVILLRGPKSINAQNRSQSPLVIIDGVVSTGSIGDLTPQDIESIEVVKGAAASSTYGSRAGNGVIQITTKSGRTASQGARFNFRTEYGVSDIAQEYPFSQRHMILMDPTNNRMCIVQTGYPACSRSVDFEDEALRINEQGPHYSLPPYVFQGDAGIAATLPKAELKARFLVQPWPKRYNPIAEAITLGQFNNSNIDLTGRFSNTGYFASASNLIQEGSIKYLKGYRRNSVRLNLDQQTGDELSTQVQTFYSRATNYPSGAFFSLSRAPAGASLNRFDKYGRIFVRASPMNQNGQNENPLHEHITIQGREEADRYIGSLQNRYTPFPWLDIESNASIDRRRNSEWELRDRGRRDTSPQATTHLGSMDMESGWEQAYNLGLTATARQNNPLGIQELAVRYNARYSFEREDNESITDVGGSTLAVPGLLDLNNVTVVDNPNSSNTSVRAIGMLGGVALDYKGKYIVDAVYRRDGSSLFGSNERWHGYYRGSLAWRASDEGWWPWKGALNDFKLRASVGTAGGRPSFAAQYETFTIGTGGTVTGSALGNKDIKPETTTETEYGIDAELFGKYGLNITYARDITTDQLLPVPPSVSTGFSTQWKNGGTMDNKTWEVALNVPIITSRDLVWTSRLTYDRNRSYITGLDVPPYFSGNSLFAVGERVGTWYGKVILRDCAQLPAQFAAQCGGPGSQFQRNSDGYVVWTGGYGVNEGITRNLWASALAGCLNSSGVAISQTGEVNCRANGGTVNNPWAIPITHWGMPIIMRDSTGNPLLTKIGSSLPDFRLALTQSFTWKKLSIHALIDGAYGQRAYNEQVAWSLGDFMVRMEDQDGRTVETAKPLGYYWRAPSPDNGAGVGGLYDTLSRNTRSVDRSTYTKLREVSIGYALGPVRGVGDWTVSLVGRNLFLLTEFYGWDPETGGGGGNLNSDAVGQTQGTGTYPQMRTFTLTLGTRF